MLGLDTMLNLVLRREVMCPRPICVTTSHEQKTSILAHQEGNEAIALPFDWWFPRRRLLGLIVVGVDQCNSLGFLFLSILVLGVPPASPRV